MTNHGSGPSRNRRQVNYPISEVTMFHNRLFNVFGIAIAVILAVMTVLTVQAGLATKAVADRSYDQVEQQRGARSAAPADRSYDPLEALRANRSATAVTVDDSYDKLDNLRAHRTWDSSAASDDPLRENDALARWLILAQNSGQPSASYDPQRANDAYAARWQGLAQSASSFDELDELDALRAHRSAAQPQADRSYDAIEQIRTIRDRW